MHDATNNTEGTTSVLASLRAMLPDRKLYLGEALTIAARQADRLLRLGDITNPPVPNSLITDLPRITVEYDPDLPLHAASGCSVWNQQRRTWVICLNPDDPATRQRFTLLHEYKHIIDHGHPGLGGFVPRTVYGLAPTEYIAEYFAGCVLMPKLWLDAAFYDGIHQARDLAELFDVSERAIEVRLAQIGLVSPPSPDRDIPFYRCQPRPWRGTYQPPLPAIWKSNANERLAA